MFKIYNESESRKEGGTKEARKKARKQTSKRGIMKVEQFANKGPPPRSFEPRKLASKQCFRNPSCEHCVCKWGNSRFSYVNATGVPRPV